MSNTQIGILCYIAQFNVIQLDFNSHFAKPSISDLSTDYCWLTFLWYLMLCSAGLRKCWALLLYSDYSHWYCDVPFLCFLTLLYS